MKIARFRLILFVPILLGCTKTDTQVPELKTSPATATRPLTPAPAGMVHVSDFKTFTSKAGRFSVDFPGDPTPSESVAVDNAVGKRTDHLFLLRIGNELQFLAGYCDMPANVTEQQLKTFSVKEGNITLDKSWHGRDSEFEGTDSVMAHRGHWYYVKNRHYDISVGWLKGHEPPKEIVDRFLNSLKILPE